MWGTFAGTLVNVTEELLNMVLWVRQTSPNFAKVRQSSHEGARILLVHPGTCLTPGDGLAEPYALSFWNRRKPHCLCRLMVCRLRLDRKYTSLVLLTPLVAERAFPTSDYWGLTVPGVQKK